MTRMLSITLFNHCLDMKFYQSVRSEEEEDDDDL
jgi:hypothetical protein